MSPDSFDGLLKVLDAKAGDLKADNDALPSGIAPGSFSPVPEIPTWDVDLHASQWADVPIMELDYDDPQQRRVIESGRFRLRLHGCCMEPHYPDGSTVEFRIVRLDREPRIARAG